MLIIPFIFIIFLKFNLTQNSYVELRDLGFKSRYKQFTILSLMCFFFFVGL